MEEEKNRKQAEADKRKQRALDRQKKQEEKKKKREETKAGKSNQANAKDAENNTNTFFSEINNPSDDLNLDMNDKDIFDFSNDNGVTKLFEKGGGVGKNNIDNDEVNSPDYKHGKPSRGGVLKGTNRYSLRSEEGSRALATPKSPMYQHTSLLTAGCCSGPKIRQLNVLHF